MLDQDHIYGTEKSALGKYENIITAHKPGITGLWQISGRSDVSFNDRLDLDVEYHKHYSLNYDFKILLKTIFYVIRKKGAT